MEFGVLQVLLSHKQDVRVVRPYPNGSVLTGSRDLTAKLYQPDESNGELYEVQNFLGPTNFVSSLCCGKTKAGSLEVYVGSFDTNIYVYTLMESKPITTLARHSDSISALAYRICNDQEVLVSGAWDRTAVIWHDKVPKFTLVGHSNSVLSVAFVARSFILTTGDKTIRKYDLTDGRVLDIFEGHTECVRGLVVVNGQQFLSCSNDAKVVLWTINGDILKTFYGHENQIYDICIVREPIEPNVEPPKNRPYKFVTVSEDSTARVWDKDVGCVQTIPIKATTLWSVAGLDNGNFVVGTSDGHAYVYTNKIGQASS